MRRMKGQREAFSVSQRKDRVQGNVVDYMFTTKGYAAHSAHEALKPFSFERREPTPTDVPDHRACLLTRCLPIVSWARAYILPGLRPAGSCICPASSCRKNASLPCGKPLSRC